MSSMVKIDIDRLQDLISAMNTAEQNLGDYRGRLSGTLDSVSMSTEPATRLNRVTQWIASEIPDLQRRLALAKLIESQTPGFPKVVSIDETLLSHKSPAEAAADGTAAAKALKDSHGDVPADLLAQIQAGQNDPYFAQAFANSVTPEELALIALDGTSKRTILQQANPPDQAALKNFEDRYKGMLAAVGSTLGTATQGTGDLALPPGYADEWVRTITAGGPDDDDHAIPGQGGAASLFLRYGQYSTPFLDRVSTGVYDYEQDAGDHGPVWRPRAFPDNNFHGAVDADGKQAYDPMASIMYALGNNPEASQNFFTGGGTTNVTVAGQKVDVNSRLKYMTQDRIWPTDDADGLGNALQAATTTWRDRTSQGMTSAQIASQTFALIGEQTGKGSDDGPRDWLWMDDDGWQAYKGMRDSLAVMLSSYSPDLFRVGADQSQTDKLGGSWYAGDNVGFPPDGPYGALLDKNLVAKLLQVEGQDESNIREILAGLTAAQQLRLSTALDQSLVDNPDAPVWVMTNKSVPLVTNSSLEAAQVFGFVVNNAYKGDADDEALAQKRAKALADVLSQASGLPFIPKPPGPWSGLIIDQVKSQLLDKIGEGPAASSGQLYGSIDSSTKTGLEQQTLNALLRGGYLDQKYYDQANGPGVKTYQAPPPGALKRDASGNLEFDFTSQDYANWVRTYAPMTWVDDITVGPYNDTWPNVK